MSRADRRPEGNVPQPVVATAKDELDILELLGVLWSGRIQLAVCMLTAVAIGYLTVALSQPIYRADALLQLEDKSGELILPTGLPGSGADEARSATEIEILRSRLVLGQVVDMLDLDIVAAPRLLPVVGEALTRHHIPDPGLGFLRSYGWTGERIDVTELEVPDDWVGQPLVVTASGSDSYRIALPDGTSREGRVGTTLRDDSIGLAVRVAVLSGAAGREFLVSRQPSLPVIQGLRARLGVVESGRQSSILLITLTDADRDRAIRILDAVAKTYLDQNVSRSSAEAQRSLDFIYEQLPLSGKAVDDAQTALNTYRQQQKSVDLTYETETLLLQATAVEQELNALLLQEEEVKARYTVNHPVYVALLNNRAKLNEQLAQLRDRAGNLPETQKEIFNLTRDLEVGQQVYLQLLNRSQELEVARASSIGSVRIIDTAAASRAPITPRKSLTLLVSLLAGAALGCVYLLVCHYTRRGVQTSEDLIRIGLPVFATVGLAPRPAGRRFRGTGNLTPILALTDPDDLVVEALRSLRTSIHYGMLDAATNSVLFTSAAPRAGKSFISENFAVVAAQAGQKVCLIDADLRRGTLRKHFGLDRASTGLAELLAGQKTLEEVIRRGPVPTLDFIAAGQYPPNPSELLMRPAFAEMLVSLNARYDLIVLDSSPVLAVTDPVIMARSVGAAILIVRHMETPMGEVQAVRRIFESAGARIAGAVLNGYRNEDHGNAYDYRYSYRSDQT